MLQRSLQVCARAPGELKNKENMPSLVREANLTLTISCRASQCSRHQALAGGCKTSGGIIAVYASSKASIGIVAVIAPSAGIRL